MDSDRYWKTDHHGWLLDTETGFIVNNDEKEYLKWKKQTQDEKAKKRLENEVDTLKTEVSQIKNLLEKIYRKLDG